MNILGISANYHNSAAGLLQNGRIVAAAEEERFSRIKFDASFPLAASRYCLAAAGLTIADIDAVAYYESPVKKTSRQLATAAAAGGFPGTAVRRIAADRPTYQIRELLGFEGQICFVDHHLSHAASAFHFSGFASAAILV